MATKETTTVKKKTFKNSDLITCRSLTNGELFVIGKKTDELYSFADCDATTEIEYQDLIYAYKTKDVQMFKPRYVVLNDDFVNECPELKALYESIYSIDDISAILDKPPAVLAEIVKGLPLGAKECLKGVVATKINNGTFDSANKIKVLDEILGTKMLLVLTDNI